MTRSVKEFEHDNIMAFVDGLSIRARSDYGKQERPGESLDGCDHGYVWRP